MQPSKSKSNNTAPSTSEVPASELFVEECMRIISETKDNFCSKINEITSVIENKGDLINAIQIMCTLIQSSFEKMNNLHEMTQQSLLQLLAAQKDLEVLNERREMFMKSNCEKIQSINTKNACSSDLGKIYITFKCEKELDKIRKSKYLIDDAKNILMKMGINVDKFGIFSISSAHIQHIKIARSVVPSLCIKFTNSRIASIVRNQMMNINAKLKEENRTKELKYLGRIYWSKDTWKLLKICWELKRLNLIKSAHVNPDGIRIRYSSSLKNGTSETRTTSLNVTSYNDIDRIREEIGDIYSGFSCNLLYDDSYFKLSYEERDRRRLMDYNCESDEDYC
jgi:hypothetical protein